MTSYITVIDLTHSQIIYRGPPNVFTGDMLVAYFKTKFGLTPTGAGPMKERGQLALGNEDGYGTVFQVLNSRHLPAGKKTINEILLQLSGGA